MDMDTNMTEEKVKEMLKVNYEIATINRVMKIKFNIVVKPEEDKVNEPNFKMESLYQINGNNYYVFKPSPFITIDISKARQRGEVWTKNWMISFNRIKLFELIMKLKKFVNAFRYYKNLFYYDNDMLCLNKDIAKEVYVDIVCSQNRHARFFPSVVVGKGVEELYEGCIFCINDIEHYCCLTIMEMEYLLYELEKINMNELALGLLLLVRDHDEEIMSNEIIRLELPSEKEPELEEPNQNESSGIAKIENNGLPL